jgi:hypothetical protein
MPRRSKRSGAEAYLENRIFEQAVRSKPSSRLFDGDRAAAIRKLERLEREGGLVRRVPPVTYRGGL